MSRATEGLLGTVHELLASDMERRLKQALSEGGEPLTAAEWSAISKFLKDNHIESLPGTGGKFDGLVNIVQQLKDDDSGPQYSH